MSESSTSPLPPPASSKYPFLSPPTHPGYLGSMGPFRILDLLGAGGMGYVFRAEEAGLIRREVALKVMKPEVALDPANRSRFLNEAQAAAALNHDHIITIFRVDEVAGAPYLVMPLLKGESLR